MQMEILEEKSDFVLKNLVTFQDFIPTCHHFCFRKLFNMLAKCVQCLVAHSLSEQLFSVV